MNLAHAIAENTQQIQTCLSSACDSKTLLPAAEKISQGASKLFNKFKRAADQGGFDFCDRLLDHQLQKLLSPLTEHIDELVSLSPADSNISAKLTELREDTRMLRRDLEEAFTSARHAVAETGQQTGSILIIDNDKANRLVLSRHLQQLGHEVESGASSSEVFQLLRGGRFDLIFLDLTIPDVNGLDILTRLKSSDRWRAIPVVMISGIRDEESVVNCIEAGADDFLIKPINRVLLNARLNAGLARKRWHDLEQLYLEDLERSHQFIRDTFGRYVSEEIVDNILAQPDGIHLGGKTASVSILMADIRGFTTLAERLSPSEVVRLLNNYLGVMSEVIINHAGTIDEFIGDAILAIFGAPISCGDHADRAVACALEMQGAIDQINRENQRQGLPEVGIGIAINTGEVIAGNIGSAKRVKYGVVGHTVNLTARMESFCREGEILVSQATVENASRKLAQSHAFEISPKGMVERLQVCNITGYT